MAHELTIRENGKVEFIEKEYVTEKQKKIQEVSTGTFCFKRDWFIRMYPTMPPLRKLGEYVLPTAFAMARDANLPMQIVQLQNADEWFGVNTPEELKEAHRALLSTLNKCEKMEMEKLGKSQRTLLERRIAALKVALALIEREQGGKPDGF